jgi:hypothetical protein
MTAAAVTTSAAADPADRLFNLLPAIYRQRDIALAPAGTDVGPLRALLRVISEQVAVLDANIAQMYENWFIETCQDWVVPYIGDLVGFVPTPTSEGTGAPSAADLLRERLLIPRRMVAKTVSQRRRRGTVAVLEELARDVAGWPAKAVEMFKLLGWTQSLDHQYPDRGGLVDLRDGNVLDLIGGPFDTTAHTVDIRGVGRNRPTDDDPAPRAFPTGRYAPTLVELFVWRLMALSVTQTPAFCQEGIGSHNFSFSILGNDTRLFNHPPPDDQRPVGGVATEIDLPTPIRRRAFQAPAPAGSPARSIASDLYYGEGKSVAIWAPGWPRRDSPQPIPRESIIPADLSGWKYRTPRNFVAVDPALGRMIFPVGQVPKNGVSVSYFYGAVADIGGGEYARPLSAPAGAQIFRVGVGGDFPTINAALDAWARLTPKPMAAVVEIVDSGVYTEQLGVTLADKEQLQIRAASARRPVIRLLDYRSDRSDAFRVSGGAGSSFVLDGLLVTGRGLRVYGPDPGNPDDAQSGDLCEVVLRHTTLVPGWGVDIDCDPRDPTDPSIELINTRAELRIEHSIVGAIEVAANEVLTDPIRIAISDSICDATREDRTALGAESGSLAFARLDIQRTTVFGGVKTHAIDLAEDCIFTGPIQVGRRQVGCVRFCYVPPGSRTPRREQCQPDLVEAAVPPSPPGAPDDRAARQEVERERVKPRFRSERYGRPDYAQLGDSTADEILAGASDEGEMGAYHDLFVPKRAANLDARLAEFTPADSDEEIVFST